MNGQEKRINEIKLRLTDSELMAVTKLSVLDDRTVTDLLHHIINGYLFGRVVRLPDSDNLRNQTNRD
jgi:hypothetical protein